LPKTSAMLQVVFSFEFLVLSLLKTQNF